MCVGHAAVTRLDAVLRPNVVIHDIERLLVPRSVQEDFNRRRSLVVISAVLPTGAPKVDPKVHRLKKPTPPVLLGATPCSRFGTPWCLAPPLPPRSRWGLPSGSTTSMGEHEEKGLGG